MSLIPLVKNFLDTTNPNYQLNGDHCIVVHVNKGITERIVIVIEYDESEECLTFAAPHVINVDGLAPAISAESLYRELLMVNGPFDLIPAAVQLDDDGDIQVGVSQYFTADNFTKRRFDFLFWSVVECAIRVKNVLLSLTLESMIPEGLKSVYLSHISQATRDDVTIEKLKETQALLEGFLAAEFSESFNELLQKDLKYIASKLQQLAPTQF